MYSTGSLMDYLTITSASTNVVESYIISNLSHSSTESFIKANILSRSLHLILTPISFITNSIDVIIGFGAGIGAICTLGKHEPTFTVAVTHLDNAKNLALGPYKNILRTINPNIIFSKNPDVYGEGFLSDFIIATLSPIAADFSDSDNFLKRHVASRLTYALLAIACLVTRVVDGIISIPAAALSILTIGQFASINSLAYRTLQAPAIISDLFYYLISFINPWAGTEQD
jgi:hypothetical protein